MKIVEVTWYDVANHGGDAMTEDEARDVEWYIVKTVGFVFGEDKESIALIMARYVSHRKMEQLLQFMFRIPKKDIVGIRELK